MTKILFTCILHVLIFFLFYFQVVCEHFEGILKLSSLLKSLIKKSNRQSGLAGKYHRFTKIHCILLVPINAQQLPQSEELASSLYNSCVLIIQHVSKYLQSTLSATAGNNTNNKEVRHTHSDT